MPKQILREKPPLELLDQFLNTVGLSKGSADTSCFQKSSISLPAFEELLPQLEPYYLPCLMSEYLHTTPLTPARAITILRHILQAHSIKLYSMERTMGRVKGIWYQLQNPEAKIIGVIQIDFT